MALDQLPFTLFAPVDMCNPEGHGMKALCSNEPRVVLVVPGNALPLMSADFVCSRSGRATFQGRSFLRLSIAQTQLHDGRTIAMADEEHMLAVLDHFLRSQPSATSDHC